MRRRKNGKVGPWSALSLAVLLVAPTIALAHIAAWLDWRMLSGALLLVSAFTFFSYRSDKRRAEAGEWRTPESTLHLASLFGGWPGAFLAQRIFRHKISKGSFQFTYWSIVLLHEFVCIDSLLHWRLTLRAVRLIRSQS